MALLPAYAVNGGTLPAEMLRMVAYNLSHGAKGVSGPGDLKVTPLPTPGGGVNIAPGGALVPAPDRAETYAVANDATLTLPVPATGSGAGRTDYVIVRVDDPQYGGQEPENPLTALYCSVELVPSVANLTYPAVVLAKISLPASTGTVQAQHITDMRALALPRSKRLARMQNVSTPLDLTSSSFINWPSESAVQVPIPEWATHAQIRADVLEALHTGSNDTDGQLVLMLGSVPAYSDARRFDEVWAGSTARTDQAVVSLFEIPAEVRGTTQALRVRGRRLNGSGYLRADSYTQVVYDIEFTEEIV